MPRKLIPILLGLAGIIIIAIVIVLLTLQPAEPPAPPLQITETPVTQAPTFVPATDIPDAAASPEDVVRYYFDKWNVKDTQGMDSVRIAADIGAYPYDDLPLEESINLTAVRTLAQADAQARFTDEIYASPTEYAVLETDFTITYNDEGKEQYVMDSTQHTGYMFWLVKEAADGAWRIAHQGY